MCFGGSKPPTPKPQTPIPQEDDEAARRATAKARNEVLAESTGRMSNDLGQSDRLGDYTPAMTRTGNAILTG